MMNVRSLSLKTQFTISVALLAAFSLGAAAVSRSGFWRFLAVFSAGLSASAAFAFLLSRCIIEPIRLLSDYAGRWRPGERWTCEAPSVGPEIGVLFERIQSLIEALNIEYRKEKDMGQLKSQLVSMVSHELNNSLSVIHAVAASLEDSEPAPGSEKRARLYRMLKRQTLLLSRTVTNLLNMGRLESGKLSLAKRRMDVPTSLQGSLDLMEVLYHNKNQKVALRLPDVPIPVYADPEGLTLAITNLLSNAVKYTPEGGSILVGCGQDPVHPRFVRVYVEDTGIGVSPDEQEKILSGHYRSERGQKLASGFGIGLSLTRSIIEAHGGRLELESEVGKGSKFSFLLPIWIDGCKAQDARQTGSTEVSEMQSGLALSGG